MSLPSHHRSGFLMSLIVVAPCFSFVFASLVVFPLKCLSVYHLIWKKFMMWYHLIGGCKQSYSHHSFIEFRVCLDWTYFCWNWKHYSKIIFKCVNSAVRPIFNMFFWIKWLWVQWIVREQCCYSTWTMLLQLWIVNFVSLKGVNEKKKKKRRKGKRWNENAKANAESKPTLNLFNLLWLSNY